ncbi:MAG: energy transducer TonB [Acidobacteria bacterium]|nr:energy transducer TonB [Acidobacteriota bacterium]
MNRRLMTATFCALALLANGTGALFAQTQQRVRQAPPPPPEQDVLIERHVEAPRVRVMSDHPEMFEMQIAPGAPGAPGESFGFSFMSSEMHFDSKIVKGAPYSAEAVTESVQMLADGNRITHASKASVYRDGEGRMRRDQTLNHIGPWATSDEPAQTIFINDPVAGANYTLNPRTRTAHKTSYGFFYGADRSGAPDEHRIVLMPGSKEAVMLAGPREGDPSRTQVFTRSGSGALVVSQDAPKSVNAGANGLSGKAIKRVPPTYPPIAKAAGAQGPVSVQIVVNEAGAVESAKAASGHPLLQQAAVDAARQWQFSPTKLSGNAVKVSGAISFVFMLPKEGEAFDNTTSIMRAPVPAGHAPAGERVKPVRESLGKQMIEGVEAEGTRTTTTFPAGMMGNERPINIVSERWYSPELQTVVMSKHSDPRFGETTYRLTDINRSEPARALFEVPSDYTVKERPQSFTRTMQRSRRPQQQQPEQK